LKTKQAIVLGIESSCDDTSAAVLCGNKILANVVASQDVHILYGGVVPELASRSHQENIVPVVLAALKKSNIDASSLDAIAFTQGPGLMGSLVVGVSFAKALALALDIPLIPVHHMKAHILAHFIEDEPNETPTFPFLCLTVSGGHTQIVQVNSASEMTVLGKTIDDAAGEAFDKAAKMLGLPYPGGPLIDQHAKNGNPLAHSFSKPKIAGLDFSFSGLKTSILYYLRDQKIKDSDFVEKNLADLCASIQFSIVSILMSKLKQASKDTGIQQIAIAGGVSANSELRNTLLNWAEKDKVKVYIPKFEYCTDNAAMIAITGKFLLEAGKTIKGSDTISADPRLAWK